MQAITRKSSCFHALKTKKNLMVFSHFRLNISKHVRKTFPKGENEKTKVFYWRTAYDVIIFNLQNDTFAPAPKL